MKVKKTRNSCTRKIIMKDEEEDIDEGHEADFEDDCIIVASTLLS